MIFDFWGFLAIIIVGGMVTSLISDVMKHRYRSVSRREIETLSNKVASLEAQVELLWTNIEKR